MNEPKDNLADACASAEHAAAYACILARNILEHAEKNAISVGLPCERETLLKAAIALVTLAERSK